MSQKGRITAAPSFALRTARTWHASKLRDGDGRLWVTSDKTHVEQKRQELSFDHLIGAGDEGRWDVEADRSGGFQVDDQLEFDGQLDRQIGRLGAKAGAISGIGQTTVSRPGRSLPFDPHKRTISEALRTSQSGQGQKCPRLLSPQQGLAVGKS